jgi:hypothetical protein
MVPQPSYPQRIVSGGQTGVDRAALDVAIELGLPHGGWCPKGRRAEDGRLPEHYQLQETSSTDYASRTAQNVLDSDGTLILHRGPLRGGTRLTAQIARQHNRPLLRIDLSAPAKSAVAAIRAWLTRHRIATLNVAGPRESTQPGIGAQTSAILRQILAPRDGKDGNGGKD